VATTALGSGDYGQWLMTARSFGGQTVPGYRADAAIPPVVPLVLAQLVNLVGEAVVALRILVLALLAFLGGAAFAAAASLFGSRTAGLLATILALLVVDQFLDLFAFGGLLQATAIGFAWITVAAFHRASSADPPAWRWWTLGAVAVGLAGLTHLGTAYILVPTGCAVAVLAAYRAEPDPRRRTARLARLAPLGAVLVALAFIWLTVLLPGSTDLTRNPASFDYRGPIRLLENLTGSWPTAVVAVVGLVAIVIGVVREAPWRSTGRAAAWTTLATWTAITAAVLGIAVVTRTATDYPRFATPLLAPLVVAAAGTGAVALGAAGSALALAAGKGTATGWSIGLLVMVVLVSAPLAADRFTTEARGYELSDAAGLSAAAEWIDANVDAGGTVLAPVREGKWIEGLTGHPALFSSAFRYSFRPDEWQRSLAADALLRSSGAAVNEYFFARTVAPGSDQTAARGLVLAANHGGEFVDLLAIAPDRTRILSTDPASPVLATLTNLAPLGRVVTPATSELRVETAFGADRQGTPVTLRQTLTLQQDSSVLDLRVQAETALPLGGIAFELMPSSHMPESEIQITGQEALVTFGRLGASQPQLRVAIVGGAGRFEHTSDGALAVRSPDPSVRLLITDLTAAPSPTVRLAWLEPAELLERYDVEAVLLTRDPALEARQARIEALGFRQAMDLGTYLLFQ
jgi:hypothetical protein